MDSKNSSQQSKNSANLPKTTRFMPIPQIFQYQNSKDYDNQQFLLDDSRQDKILTKKPIFMQQKPTFTTTLNQNKHLQNQQTFQAKNIFQKQPMEIEKPNQNLKNFNLKQNIKKQNQTQIDSQIAALDQEFEKIQKIVNERENQNKKSSPQKSLEAIKQRKLKRYSERGINLQEFLTVVPQVQNKSGRKTFDVQEINAIKDKADKMTDQISHNKQQQVNKNLQAHLSTSNSQLNQPKQQIKSIQIEQKMNLAKKKKQRLTLSLYQIMGLMQKVQDKQQKIQNSNYQKKKRNNRLTIDVQSIAKMFQNDSFLKEKSSQFDSNVIIEDDRQNEETPIKIQYSLKSHNRMPQMQNLSQQQKNRLFTDKYFSEIDARIQALKKQNSRLQQLKQVLERQKKISQEVGFKINPEQLQIGKRLNQEYIKQTKSLQQNLSLQRYTQSMKIINSFNFRFEMHIYTFEVDRTINQNQRETFFTKFKIGSSLVKLRRTRESRDVQVRIKTLVASEQQETDSLFDAQTQCQIIYNFITKKINNEKTLLQLLFKLSTFYQKIKQLQVQLDQLIDFLNLTDFELGSTLQQLSFKYILNSKELFVFEIKLLNILEKKSKKNFVSIYSKRKRQYVELPSDYRPFEEFLLFNQIDYIQQTYSVFDH